MSNTAYLPLDDDEDADSFVSAEGDAATTIITSGDSNNNHNSSYLHNNDESHLSTSSTIILDDSKINMSMMGGGSFSFSNVDKSYTSDIGGEGGRQHHHSDNNGYSSGNENGTNNSAAMLLNDDEENQRLVQEQLRQRLLSHASQQLEQDQHQQHPSSSLNGLNYLNGLTFIVSIFVSYCIGVTGLYGIIPTRWDIYSQYETLVLPHVITFRAMWLPILLGEAIFTIFQFLPNYRSRSIIQIGGTGYYFFYTCLLQTIWTLCFAFKVFVVSFISCTMATISLALLLMSQHNARSSSTGGGRSGSSVSGRQGRRSKIEYYLFRFPFKLHFGWMVTLTSVHFSLLMRELFPTNISIQLAANTVSLCVLLPIASFFIIDKNTFLLFSSSHQHRNNVAIGQPNIENVDFIIPSIIIFSYAGIAYRLKDPSSELIDTFSQENITAIQESSIILCCIVSLVLIPRIVLWICRSCFTIRVVELDEGESYGDDEDDVIINEASER